MDNRTPLIAVNPTQQALRSPDFSKASAGSPLGSPRLGHGGRHSLPELPGEFVSLKSAPPVTLLPVIATGISEPFTSPFTPPGTPVSVPAMADLPAMGSSKQVSWRDESPYKVSKRSVLDTGGASSSAASAGASTTSSHAACTTSTTTAAAVSTATVSSTTPKPGPRGSGKFLSFWSKGKENSPARPKLERINSTPQKGVAVKFSRQRLDKSPAPDLSSSSPRSPERQTHSDARPSISGTPIDRFNSERPQWKSPHAVNSPASAARGVATSSGFQSPFARTYSSLDLPKFHRIDEPIVVISAWGTVVGTVKIHLKRCMEERPVDEGTRKAIEDVATNFAIELNQSRPSRSALNETLLKLALLIRDVDSNKFHASYVLKYQITQMAAAIEYMPDELPSRWRTSIESDAVTFGAWVLHGITAHQPHRGQSQ